ncbi:MAG TPA: acyltransferase [Deltaproteobacteria bacterium]|nr:acyltransferase [Deltaproteobacteria bacterium]
MRRDHRPYYLKKIELKVRDWYVEHFLRPHFEHLGKGCTFMKPWHVHVFGQPIELGDYANVITTPEHRVRLTVWSRSTGEGAIRIGNYCLLCPGLRISSATEITIGDSCMMASGVYITDSDWHGIYDRLDFIGKTGPVRIGTNVWIGDGAIVCKGVTVGENSIIGAGSVVIRDIPPNTVAAGNPAVPVRTLDPNIPLKTRADWFSNPMKLAHDIEEIDRDMLRGNTLLGWLTSVMFPDKTS